MINIGPGKVLIYADQMSTKANIAKKERRSAFEVELHISSTVVFPLARTGT